MHNTINAALTHTHIEKETTSGLLLLLFSRVCDMETKK